MKNVKEIREVEFDQAVLKSGVPVLVDFYATWCGPCQMLAPSLEALAEEYGDRLRVVKVNVDESPGLAQRYGIRGVPTLMAFRDGKPCDTIVGLLPMKALRKKLDALAAPARCACSCCG